MEGFEGQRALVTGASSGIGQAIAVRLAREGADVAINYRSGRSGAAETRARIEAFERCADEVRACGRAAALVRADVSEEEDVRRMFDEAVAELGGVDVLVSNAGIQIGGASDEIEIGQFDQVLAVNLRGAYLCAREFLRRRLDAKEGGVILNVSSVHEVIPKPRYVGYSVSKGGLGNLTRTLALEYADRGIRVNAIGPGATVTSMNRGWTDDPDKRARVERHIPLGRAGEAEEMAAAAAFLCSAEAAYITGQTLLVDGGLSLYPDFESPWSSE